MEVQSEKEVKLNKLAKDVLLLSRNTLLVNLRFLDVALSQFELLPIQSSTLLTDGRHILYNSHYVLETYRLAREIPVRDYLHIVLHCVFRHMYVNPTLNRTYWDLACDIAVENIISELNLRATTAPREQLQTKYITTIKKELKYITAEKIYSYLRQTEPDSEKIAEIRDYFNVDNHEIWYMRAEEIEEIFGISNSGDKDSSAGNDESTGVDSETEDDLRQDNSDGQDADSDHDIDRVDSVGVKAEMAAAWQKISARMQVDLETFGKQHGIGSGAMSQNLAAVNREKYDYTAFLKKFAVMGEAMKINDDEFDYIFYTYGMQLYKKMPLIEPLEYKEIKAIKEFVIAIDTSGSTSGDLVQKFVQKTYNILKSTESFFTKINIHIIQCDADIQEDKKITCQDDFDEYLKTMQIRGLGGTDFRPVFEYVEKLRAGKEFQNFKGLIYFTDGCGNFPTRKPDYDTAFVFVDDEYNNPSVPPWAIKLILQKDEI